MDPKECTQLRDSAFELINTANNCSTDADCHPTEWPGCKKPVNTQSFDKIHQMMQSFQKGKCEEKPATCKETPPVYCAEGICAFRYKSSEKPGEGMRIE
jgi:hypothetical protein